MLAPCFAQPCGEMCRSEAESVSSFPQEKLCPPIGTSLGFMHFLKILWLCVDFWLQITTKNKQIYFKTVKKKKGNSNHSVNKNDSASQLTVLSGPVTFVGGGFHSIWHLVKCLHSCGKPGAVISGTLVDLLSGRVKMALPLSLSSLPKLHVVTFEDFARV